MIIRTLHHPLPLLAAALLACSALHSSAVRAEDWLSNIKKAMDETGFKCTTCDKAGKKYDAAQDWVDQKRENFNNNVENIKSRMGAFVSGEEEVAPARPMTPSQAIEQQYKGPPSKTILQAKEMQARRLEQLVEDKKRICAYPASSGDKADCESQLREYEKSLEDAKQDLRTSRVQALPPGVPLDDTGARTLNALLDQPVPPPAPARQAVGASGLEAMMAQQAQSEDAQKLQARREMDERMRQIQVAAIQQRAREEAEKARQEMDAKREAEAHASHSSEEIGKAMSIFANMLGAAAAASAAAEARAPAPRPAPAPAARPTSTYNSPSYPSTYPAYNARPPAQTTPSSSGSQGPCVVSNGSFSAGCAGAR